MALFVAEIIFLKRVSLSLLFFFFFLLLRFLTNILFPVLEIYVGKRLKSLTDVGMKEIASVTLHFSPANCIGINAKTIFMYIWVCDCVRVPYLTVKHKCWSSEYEV